jgi:hypothetical protein
VAFAHFDVAATAPAAASYSVVAAVKVTARPVVVTTVRASAFPVTAILVPVVPVFVAVVTAAVASCENSRNLHTSPFSHSWDASQESIVVFPGTPLAGSGQARGSASTQSTRCDAQ